MIKRTAAMQNVMTHIQNARPTKPMYTDNTIKYSEERDPQPVTSRVYSCGARTTIEMRDAYIHNLACKARTLC